MPQCPTCGAQVDEGTEICPECGMDLTSVETTPAEQQAPQLQIKAEPGGAAAPAEAGQAEQAAQPAQQAPSAAPSPAQAGALTVTAPATLTLMRAGAATSEIFNLGERVIVGRFDADTGPVDVDLGPLPESMYISRRHAEIFKNQDGKWMIHDLGSSNGTFVRNLQNGQFEKVQDEREIKDGDEIAFGNARFMFNAP